MKTRDILILLVAVAIVAYVAASMGARSGSQGVEAGDGYDYSAPAAPNPFGDRVPSSNLIERSQQDSPTRWFDDMHKAQEERRRRQQERETQRQLESQQEQIDRLRDQQCQQQGYFGAARYGSACR